MAFQQRNDYCVDCIHWRYFGGHYGCKKFEVYAYDDRDRLCNGRYKVPRQRKPY